ncbi:MAG: carbonic anhydrase, partial [Rhodoferax sp.]
NILPSKKLTLVIDGKPHSTIHAASAASAAASAPGGAAAPVAPARAAAPRAAVAGQGSAPASASAISQQYAQARAKALGQTPPPSAPASSSHSALQWSYAGEEAGPQAWARLKPEYSQCANGRRQSPIAIDDADTLQGPAEALQFHYVPSNASVLNNGRSIEVEVQGDNTLTVRGTTYRLTQVQFHAPAEEQVNGTRAPMAAHLVHRSDDGQLAVLAVLLEFGAANALIDKVSTYMPLDSGDRVRMPPEWLNLADLLPTDQRYYQFLGSLTTPPCTEGVLWMVLKTPVPLSASQHRLFVQLYPHNARPLQALNGRPVRSAQ